MNLRYYAQPTGILWTIAPYSLGPYHHFLILNLSFQSDNSPLFFSTLHYRSVGSCPCQKQHTETYLFPNINGL